MKQGSGRSNRYEPAAPSSPTTDSFKSSHLSATNRLVSLLRCQLGFYFLKFWLDRQDHDNSEGDGLLKVNIIFITPSVKPY